MSQDIHYLEGDDYLDAVPAADGVILRMSDNAAVTLNCVLEQLARLLEHGELPETRRLRRRRSDRLSPPTGLGARQRAAGPPGSST
jgi:hypothetical protein